MNEPEKPVNVRGSGSAIDQNAGAERRPVEATAIKARLRERLAAAESESKPAKILVDNFRAQWLWSGIEDGQPVELQQLTPTTPDEEVGNSLRTRHRLDSSTGEYRPMNRYARVHGLRQALVLLDHASRNFQAQGLYVIGNRLKRAVADKAKADVWITFAKDSGTTDPDIASRCVLMFDIDPRRGEGVKDISATADERRNAIERALDLYADLVEVLGSDGSLAFVSSGNGAQVHVRVDLPNSMEVTQNTKRLLLVLDQLYSSDTEELDTAVFDPKRLFPACGTWKRKGANNSASGRVHRPSLFLPGVEKPDVLSADAVARLLAALEARLTGEQKAAVDADMRTPGARPAAGAGKTSSGNGAGESSFTKANAISVGDVARKLGLDPEALACPACGATTNVDSLEGKGLNIIKCPHATCGARSWAPVSLVAKVAFNCDDLKGTKGVAAQVLGWFADNFGLEVWRARKDAGKPTAEEKAASDTRYRDVMEEMKGRAVQRTGGASKEAVTPARTRKSTVEPPGVQVPRMKAETGSAATSPACALVNTRNGVVAEPGTSPRESPPASPPSESTSGAPPEPGTEQPPAGPEGTPADSTATKAPAAAAESAAPTADTVSTDPPALSDDEIDERLRAVVGRSALEQESAVVAIHDATGKTKGALKSRLKELEAERAEEDDEPGDATESLGRILDSVTLVRGADSRVYARFGNEYVPVDAGAFHARVAFLFHEATGGYVATGAIDKLMLPRHGGEVPRERVPIRHAAANDGTLWIDLGDWHHFVKITSGAVTVETECPLAFRRPEGMLALPVPVVPKHDAEATAALAAYATLLNVDRPRFAAIFAWQVSAMRPMELPDADGGYTEYPILKLTGGEGTGKTMRAEQVRAAIDPKEPMLTGAPAKPEDICISGEHGRVLATDNITYMDQQHSDARCRRSTGDGDERRALFTDRSLAHFVGSNPQLFTSIAEAATEADLLSRCISVDLDKTPKGKTRRKLRADYKRLAPSVVGALCHCVSRALKNLDAVELPDDVRLLDSAQWALAAAEGGGFTREEVLGVFSRSVEHADAITMEKAVVLTLLEVVAPGTTRCWAMGDLLEALTAKYERRIPDIGKATRKLPRDWPQKPEGLRAKLKKAEAALGRCGVKITWASDGGGANGRGCTIARSTAPERTPTDTTATANVSPGLSVVDAEEDWTGQLDAAASHYEAAHPPEATQSQLQSEGATAGPTASQNLGGNQGTYAVHAVHAVVSPLKNEEEREDVADCTEQPGEQPDDPSSFSTTREEVDPTATTASTAQVEEITAGSSSRSCLAVAPRTAAELRSPLSEWTYGAPSDPVRARVVGTRVEKTLVWREDDPYPMNWQVVVDLETELGPAIFVQTLGILYPPADSLRSLTSFGGELQPDGTWAIHPVDLIVQVCRRRIWPFGDVREVVAASVVPATAADAAVTALAAQADEASVVAPAPRSGVNLGGLSSRLAVPANDVGPEIAHGATRRDVLIETTPTSPIQEPIPSRTPSPARESVPAAPIAPEPDENGDDEVRESGAPEDNLDPARTPPADAAPALAPASPAPPPVRVLTAALEPAVDDRADDAPVPDDGHEEDVDAELERYRRARWDEEG